MALSLLCGGLGVASAANGTVHVAESSMSSDPAVYTTEKVDTLLNDKANATDVTKNTGNIATNTANIKTLQSELGNKADESTVTAALGGKANTSLDNLSDVGKLVIKDTMSADMAKKANTDTVTALEGRVGGVEGKVTTLEGTVGNASGGLVKDVNDLKTQGATLNNALGSKADKSDLDAAKAKITTNETDITALRTKTTGLSADGKSLNGMNSVETDALTVKGEIKNGAGVTTTLTDIKASMDKANANETAIGQLQTTTTNQQTAIDGLNAKTTQISYNAAKGTTVNGVDFKDAEVDANGKGLKDVSTLHTTGAATIGGALTAAGVNAGTEAITGGSLSVTGAVTGSSVNAGSGEIKTTGAVNAGTLNTTGDATVGGELNATGKVSGNGLDAKTGAITGGSLSVTGAVTGSSVNAGSGEIKTTGAVNAGILNTTGNATVGGELNATGKVSGKGLDAGTGAITGGSLSVTGDTTLNKTDVNGALNVTGESNLKNTTVDGTLSVNKETTLNGKLTANDEATFTKKVTMEDDLEVKGELKTDKIAMENKKTDPDGTIHNSSTTITADGITHNGEVKKNGVTTESQFTHTEKGSETYAKRGDAIDQTETRSDVTADGVNTEVKDSKGNRTNTSQTTEVINGFAIDKDGNKTDMKVTATENSIQIQDKDGKNTNLQVNKMGSSMTEIKNEDGKTTKTEQTATDITNTAEQGTIKNDAMNIENNASGNITNNAQHGTITNNAKDIVNNATGDMTNTVGGKLTTTVTGQATENFNGGLDTTVAGTEKHTVNGKQINTVTEGQENIISGGQTNTITGGQINNITGDQTTTITGNKNETVTENVKEDYKKDLTTTVGGNETHEVKGTKTETVEGKLTENFKGGQETNVTGDQTTNVSGTQTINATDINRNASSGMIDTVDNAYGTNKETKVAGSTTTEVSIKGTSESGTYIRGATEARDYIIKGTLSNSETKTVDATSTEITDGNGKTSATIQDKTQISGSVTNGTSSAVSNVKADSIDTAVIEGTNTSLISQKKDSITSAVGNGTTSTVIQQGDKDITIASNGGTVGIVGKDIINNATDEITNTAGTKITDKVGNNTRVIDQTSITDTVGTASRKIEDGKITDTAGDSTVTTENGKGTTFAKAGSAAYSTEAGATKDTNIAGNLITTGRVNANELGVSDKDEHGNTADLSVKAEDGVKASASNGTTTGSLDVKAEEVSSSVKDASGKGSTFKQRIDAIMMESKDVSIKAEGTLTNEAKDIVTNASNSITEKVGETNVTTKTTTSSKSEIQNADTITSVQQTENMVQSYVGKKDGSATNVTTNFANASANMVTENGQSSTVLNNKDGLLVRNTANGSSFITADGTNTGAALEWTNVKGNEISTGKVEANYVKMDYADVMKDLGVHGNAKVGKNLEVTGTSTLTGDVTMGSNATVKGTFNVEGNTNLKNTKVDGTLDVMQKATFGDSVSIAKDLSVGGDVTANSYKVGGKTYISAAGINANDQKITNVADGSISEGSKDAVNGGQLYTVKNDLEGKVNKVGANAAAMANLHPMEFDPDSKWNIAAAIGNYGSESAAALGAFYRPNDDVMVNLSTTFGTGENMVGGGVSVRLGKGGNKLSREENNALKDQVNDLTARMDALLSVLNPNMSKDFPDVPENHWAYEAVSRLAGNDIVQGYPDGEFHGERTMTRYEMAEIIYNALSRGAEAEKELVEEFKPELQAMAASEKATAERAEG